MNEPGSTIPHNGGGAVVFGVQAVFLWWVSSGDPVER